MELTIKLKKLGCKNVRFSSEPNKWYKLELIYNGRYYRFFNLTFEELERESLHGMRNVSRKLNYREMTRGEIYGSEAYRFKF